MREPALGGLPRWVAALVPGVSARRMRPYFDHVGTVDGPTWAGLATAAQRHSAAHAGLVEEPDRVTHEIRAFLSDRGLTA